MPILPSGLVVGVDSSAIPDDLGPNWFACPPGHFWYMTPDLAICPPVSAPA